MFNEYEALLPPEKKKRHKFLLFTFVERFRMVDKYVNAPTVLTDHKLYIRILSML